MLDPIKDAILINKNLIFNIIYNLHTVNISFYLC